MTEITATLQRCVLSIVIFDICCATTQVLVASQLLQSQVLASIVQLLPARATVLPAQILHIRLKFVHAFTAQCYHYTRL
jgi:hypothetical protein